MDPIEVRELLNELCADLGFCMPPHARSQLARTTPNESDAFARAVFKAENLDPDLADRRLFLQVRDRIADAMHLWSDKKSGR